MPSVSVLVPNYNHARFLDERLQSIFQQTYQDFEVIFLDDASTDTSVEVFQKYGTRSNVRAILNEHNSGSTFRQWNRGVRAARGRYLWIAESDDVAEPQLLETLVTLLDRNPHVGVAYCNSLIIDGKGVKQYTVDRWSDSVDSTRWSQDYIHSGTDECRNYLLCRNTIPNASAVVFRKSIYEQAGYANETMTRCGDWWVWVQLLLRSDIAYVASPLNLFRRHTTSSASVGNHNVALEETLQILHEIASHLDLTEENESLMSQRFTDHLAWRDYISNGEGVVLPSTILYLAAITSERLYSTILDFVSTHDSWEIDWSPLPASALATLDSLISQNRRGLLNLTAIVTKLNRQLSTLTAERKQYFSSRSYRLVNKMQQMRARFAPADSLQEYWLRKLLGVVCRIRNGRSTPMRMSHPNHTTDQRSAA